MKSLALTLVLAVTACGALKPSTDTDVQARAQTVGEQIGNLTCLAIVVKHPETKSTVLAAASKMADVLASPDPTMAGVAEAIGHIPDPEDRLLAQGAVSSLVIVLNATGHPVPVLSKGSPAYFGLAAFASACQKALI